MFSPRKGGEEEDHWRREEEEQVGMMRSVHTPPGQSGDVIYVADDMERLPREA